MLWYPLFIIGYGIRLQEFIHHTAFCNIQLKKIIFCQSLICNKSIVFYLKGMNGVVLTKRATIHPAIGKDKKVLSHKPCALKCFTRIKKNFGESYMNTCLRSLGSNTRHNLKPLFRTYLPPLFAHTLLGRVSPQSYNLNKKSFYSDFGEQWNHTMEMVDV